MGKRFPSLSFVIILLIIGLVFWQRQAIFDWWVMRGYEPPQRISQLADDTTMTNDARRIFYVNRPILDDRTEFRGHCRVEEHSIVLGCYSRAQGIFLLDVQDKRLNGIIEVTAAHEMLHAAYDRLSRSEKNRIDNLTSKAYDDLDNRRIKEVVDLYRQQDPGVVPNELHSILGTEVGDLPEELETYYKQYFKDRSKVVAFSKQYERAFTDLKSRVDQYDAQMSGLRADIESNQALISSQAQDLDRSRQELNNLRNNGQIEEYNARVDGFNNLIEQYNQLVATTRQLISQYNELVERRNSVSLEHQELIDAINPNFQSQSAQ